MFSRLYVDLFIPQTSVGHLLCAVTEEAVRGRAIKQLPLESSLFIEPSRRKRDAATEMNLAMEHCTAVQMNQHELRVRADSSACAPTSASAPGT